MPLMDSDGLRSTGKKAIEGPTCIEGPGAGIKQDNCGKDLALDSDKVFQNRNYIVIIQYIHTNFQLVWGPSGATNGKVEPGSTAKQHNSAKQKQKYCTG